MLHTDIEHKEQQKSEKFRSSNKIWLPESLDLDASEDNGEEYLFWLARFNSYLVECGIVKTDEKYSKLKSRLSFKIFQHISDAQDYDSLIIALENLYVKKRNIYAARNCLVSCKQMSGENVRAYLLRLNQLAKLCQFSRPKFGDGARQNSVQCYSEGWSWNAYGLVIELRWQPWNFDIMI